MSRPASKPPRAALAALALAATTGLAHAGVVIDYAAVGWDATGSLYDEIIGAPDLRYAVNPWVASKFTSSVRYDGLAAALGMSEAELGRWQLIAWEGNGGAPAASGGWESAEWVFHSDAIDIAARFDEITGGSSNPAVDFLTGSISGAQFDALFGTRGADPVMSWLLTRLPDVVDPRGAGFMAGFRPGGRSAGGLGEGTPEPDAIGLIASVPEPATAWLVVAGLAALARRRGRPAAA